jgi:DNA-binding response OmpR family regulator
MDHLRRSRRAAAMNRILLVEDDRHLANAISLVLPAYGFEVRTAGDGEQALREVARVMPQAVLLDIGLPALDGLEVARRIRASCGDGLRLVAYTGRSDITQSELTEAGFDEWLVKPASLELLLRAIGYPACG